MRCFSWSRDSALADLMLATVSLACFWSFSSCAEKSIGAPRRGRCRPDAGRLRPSNQKPSSQRSSGPNRVHQRPACGRECLGAGWMASACPGASPKRLGVVAKWLPFIRINLVVAAMSDLPVKKDGPDRPDGMPLRGALDDRLDLRSCDPGSKQPDDRLKDDDGCG